MDGGMDGRLVGLLEFLDRLRRGRRTGRVMVVGERNWACLREKAWCMIEQAMLFVSRSLRSRNVDRFPTTHDGVEEMRRLAAPVTRGREARIACWAVLFKKRWKEEDEWKSLGTSQVRKSDELNGTELERKIGNGIRNRGAQQHLKKGNTE